MHWFTLNKLFAALHFAYTCLIPSDYMLSISIGHLHDVDVELNVFQGENSSDLILSRIIPSLYYFLKINQIIIQF